MSTAKRIDQLRRDVQSSLEEGLRELRAGNEALRGELLSALTKGLDAQRDELQRALGREQRELALAHKENRDLRRQLDEARAAQSCVAAVGDDGSIPPAAPLTWPPAIVGEDAEPPEEIRPVQAAAEVIALPEEPPAAPAPDQNTASSAPSSKEIPVPEQNEEPGPGPQEQEQELAARIAADFAAAARDLDAGREPAPVGTAPSARSAQEESTGRSAPSGPPTGEQVLFDTLYRAASISSADIVCHPHTWQFIADCAAGAEHFQLPSATTDADRDGLATIRISGRSLVAVLHSLYRAYLDASLSSDLQGKALTLGYYIQIAHEIRKTRPVFSRYDGPDPDPVNRPRTRVVLDQRPGYVVDGGLPDQPDD